MSWRDRGSYNSEQINDYTASPKTKEQCLDEGINNYQAKNYDKALMACERALQLDPNYFLAYYGEGLALHDLGHYLKALAAFECAIQLVPKNPIAYIGKGNSFCKLNRYEEALAAFEQAESAPEEVLAAVARRTEVPWAPAPKRT